MTRERIHEFYGNEYRVLSEPTLSVSCVSLIINSYEPFYIRDKLLNTKERISSIEQSLKSLSTCSIELKNFRDVSSHD